MATAQIHSRSISLPSRLYPINPTNVEDQVQKLKSLQILSFSKAVPISSEAIQSGLVGLAELYNSVEELVQYSPSNQKSIILDQIHLDTSVELIDSCNNTRELFQVIRANVQTLRSALRRKSQNSSIQDDIATYFSIRKKINIFVFKRLKSLKILETNIKSSSPSALKEVTALTIAIFKCILVFLSWSTVKSGGWNLVSRLILSKSETSSRDQCVMSEVESADFAVLSCTRALDAKMVQRRLKNLDDCVEGLEGKLEILFRQLITCRVSLLNILTDS